MPESAHSIAAFLFPEETFPDVEQTDAAAIPATNEGVFVPPLVDHFNQSPVARSIQIPPIEYVPTVAPEKSNNVLRRNGAFTVLGAIAAAAAVSVLVSSNTPHFGSSPDTIAQPSATSTSPKAESTNGPFATASATPEQTTPPVNVTMTNFVEGPIVFGTAKNHSVNSADAAVGPFKVRFTYKDQMHELGFPGGVINMSDSSKKVLYSVTEQPDVKTGFYNKKLTLRTSSIAHSSNLNVSLAQISDRIVTKAEQLIARGDTTICATKLKTEGCPDAPKPVSKLSAARLKSVKSSIEVLAFYAAQKQCSSYASGLLLANINAQEDNFVSKLHVPADDISVVYDSKKAFNYIATPVAYLKKQNAVTSLSGLQLAFGTNVSIPITCKS